MFLLIGPIVWLRSIRAAPAVCCSLSPGAACLAPPFGLAHAARVDEDCVLCHGDRDVADLELGYIQLTPRCLARVKAATHTERASRYTAQQADRAAFAPVRRSLGFSVADRAGLGGI